MRVKFPSLAHPAKYAYAYDSSSWHGGEVEASFQMFETYGDGLTQHSNEWPITRDFMADYLASLGLAMLLPAADPDLLRFVSMALGAGPGRAEIAFAASVKWKESDGRWNSRRYYSVEEKKISAAPSKAHDKRYFEIGEWCDGKPQAIHRMLMPGYGHGLQQYLYASAIREWVHDQPSGQMDFPPEFLGWWDHTRRRESLLLSHAMEACQSIVQAHRLIEGATSMLDGIRRNNERTREEAAERQAAALAAEATHDRPALTDTTEA